MILTKQQRLTLTYLRQTLDYDPITGILRWRKRRNSFGNKAISGSVAGLDRGLQRANQRVRSDNKIGLKGVSKTGRGRYRARLKGIELGYFHTPEEAHAAYVVAAHQHFGEYARTS